MNTEKRRGIRTRKYNGMVIDITVLLFIYTAVFVIPGNIAWIGYRNYLVMGAVQGMLMMFFMVMLEEYSCVISMVREHIVIFVLSTVYAWIIVSAINLLLFASARLFLANSIFACAGFALLTAVNYIHARIHKNEPRLRLLIVAEKETNFMRMKRIKYGTLGMYESWYEEIHDDSPEGVREFIDAKFADYDVICLLDRMSGRLYDMFIESAMAMNKPVYVVPQMIDIQKNCAKLVRFDDVMTFYIPECGLSRAECFCKRVFDIAVSLVGLIIAAIPMLIIAAAIKLTSPGPIIYKQKRLTKSKKEFYIYKFRTMIPDAEKVSGPVFAQKGDPRITPIGKVLRSMRLDELPQIINILKGDMSVVGPRPERPMFVEEFEKAIPNYNYRFAVKAGLTSLSHVYGRYSTYIQDRTGYDLFYITHYSFLLDLKIMLLTSKTMFMPTAAEGEDEYKQADQKAGNRQPDEGRIMQDGMKGTDKNEAENGKY